jgi:hypothetical protein
VENYMSKSIWVMATVGLLVLGFTVPAESQRRNDDEAERERKRREIFGKSFEERVEEAVDRGCDWLKEQQGIEQGEDPAVFGQFRDQPTYRPGVQHRFRFARTAFPIQALCKSGVFHDDPAIEKAMNYLRRHYNDAGVIQSLQGNVTSQTYEDSTVINAIEAYYISAYEARARGLHNPRNRFKRDEEGNRVPIKRWGTEEQGARDAKRNAPDRKLNLSREDRRLAELAVKALEMRFRKAYGAAGWRYQPTGRGANAPEVDVSATQYALLGLKAASRLGIGYDKSMLMDCFHLLRQWQDEDGPKVERRFDEDGEEDKEDEREARRRRGDRSTGSGYEPREGDRARGWSYTRRDPHTAHGLNSYGSMTAAAICALVILRDELEKDRALARRWERVDKECDQMISDGLGWLITNWAMDHNPKVGDYRYYYYLYTIERMAMLGGVDFIGPHDWYRQGADILLEQQKDNGRWETNREVEPSDIYDTCYALLFLKRSTEGIDRPVPVFTGGDYDD